MLKIAILDLYNGKPNEGMRCIKMLVNDFFKIEGIEGNFEIFDVRQKNDVPSIHDFDIFISASKDLLAKKIEDAVSKDLANRGQTKRSTFEIGDAIAKLVNS